jgi:hypothetical protein
MGTQVSFGSKRAAPLCPRVPFDSRFKHPQPESARYVDLR